MGGDWATVCFPPPGLGLGEKMSDFDLGEIKLAFEFRKEGREDFRKLIVEVERLRSYITIPVECEKHTKIIESLIKERDELKCLIQEFMGSKAMADRIILPFCDSQNKSPLRDLSRIYKGLSDDLPIELDSPYDSLLDQNTELIEENKKLATSEKVRLDAEEKLNKPDLRYLCTHKEEPDIEIDL